MARIEKPAGFASDDGEYIWNVSSGDKILVGNALWESSIRPAVKIDTGLGPYGITSPEAFRRWTTENQNQLNTLFTAFDPPLCHEEKILVAACLMIQTQTQEALVETKPASTAMRPGAYGENQTVLISTRKGRSESAEYAALAANLFHQLDIEAAYVNGGTASYNKKFSEPYALVYLPKTDWVFDVSRGQNGNIPIYHSKSVPIKQALDNGWAVELHHRMTSSIKFTFTLFNPGGHLTPTAETRQQAAKPSACLDERLQATKNR